MAAFTEDQQNRLDWEILRDGSISLYRDHRFLNKDIQWFRENLYEVYSFDCTAWLLKNDMYADFQSTLSFPAYFGRNLDALADCLSDLAILDEGGLAVVLDGFNAYAKNCGAALTHSGRPEAEVILDILAHASRTFSLAGKRLVTLVQTNDPWMRFERLGGQSTQWNRREWLNKNRGL